MKKLIFAVALALLLPLNAYAACDTLGCWELVIMGEWDVDGSPTVNETPGYEGKCQQDMVRNVKELHGEIVNISMSRCWYPTSIKDLLQVDPQFRLITGDQKQDTSYCSDPAYATEVDCLTVDFSCDSGLPQHNTQAKCENAGFNWVGVVRGVWTFEESWVETYRPRSQPMEVPDFVDHRNYMKSKGFTDSGIDSCLGNNVAGRTVQQIIDDSILCIEGVTPESVRRGGGPKK